MSSLKSPAFQKVIYKEERYLIRELRQSLPEELDGKYCFLLVIGGVLRHPFDVDKVSVSSEKGVEKPFQHPWRIVFVPLWFSFDRLDINAEFELFKQLLFFTRAQYEKCFTMRIWQSEDGSELVARTPELRRQLTALTKLHNTISNALGKIRGGRSAEGHKRIEDVLSLLETCVTSHHHRQFSDILSILHLLQKEGQPEICSRLKRHLVTLAEERLQDNDPRWHVFQILSKLAPDTDGQLYLAFDAFCRALWTQNLRDETQNPRGETIAIYYSYNQASIPRIANDRFYSFFDKKSTWEIVQIPYEAITKFGLLATETFCVWHTTISYLSMNGHRFHAYQVAYDLCRGLRHLVTPTVLHLNTQLNVDLALSFNHLACQLLNPDLYRDAIVDAYECSLLACHIRRSAVTDPGEFDAVLSAVGGRRDLIAQKLRQCQMPYSPRMAKLMSALDRAEDQGDIRVLSELDEHWDEYLWAAISFYFLQIGNISSS